MNEWIILSSAVSCQHCCQVAVKTVNSSASSVIRLWRKSFTENIINQQQSEKRDKMSKRILVTGGTGLVGKGLENTIKEEISSALNNEEWFFIGKEEGDLTYVSLHWLPINERNITTLTTSTIYVLIFSDLNATRLIFQKYKPTHVVHLAAMVGGLFHNMANNLDFLVGHFVKQFQRSRTFHVCNAPTNFSIPENEHAN